MLVEAENQCAIIRYHPQGVVSRAADGPIAGPVPVSGRCPSLPGARLCPAPVSGRRVALPAERESHLSVNESTNQYVFFYEILNVK